MPLRPHGALPAPPCPLPSLCSRRPAPARRRCRCRARQPPGCGPWSPGPRCAARGAGCRGTPWRAAGLRRREWVGAGCEGPSAARAMSAGSMWRQVRHAVEQPFQIGPHPTGRPCGPPGCAPPAGLPGGPPPAGAAPRGSTPAGRKGDEEGTKEMRVCPRAAAGGARARRVLPTAAPTVRRSPHLEQGNVVAQCGSKAALLAEVPPALDWQQQRRCAVSGAPQCFQRALHAAARWQHSSLPLSARFEQLTGSQS